MCKTADHFEMEKLSVFFMNIRNGMEYRINAGILINRVLKRYTEEVIHSTLLISSGFSGAISSLIFT